MNAASSIYGEHLFYKIAFYAISCFQQLTAISYVYIHIGFALWASSKQG